MLVRTHALIVYRSLTKLNYVLQLRARWVRPRRSILWKACGSNSSTQVFHSNVSSAIDSTGIRQSDREWIPTIRAHALYAVPQANLTMIGIKAIDSKPLEAGI